MGIVVGGVDTFSLPSRLHSCIGKCLFWKADPRVVKIKIPLGITEYLSYLRLAGLPAGKCTPGGGCSTQMRSGDPPLFSPSAELHAEDKELPWDSREQRPRVQGEFVPAALAICVTVYPSTLFRVEFPSSFPP